MKTVKLLKITSVLAAIVAVLSFIYMLGVIGSLDNNSIGTAEGFKNCFFGVVALVAGAAISGLASNEAEYRERQARLNDSQN